jgi:hypothetical protein
MFAPMPSRSRLLPAADSPDLLDQQAGSQAGDGAMQSVTGHVASDPLTAPDSAVAAAAGVSGDGSAYMRVNPLAARHGARSERLEEGQQRGAPEAF